MWYSTGVYQASTARMEGTSVKVETLQREKLGKVMKSLEAMRVRQWKIF